VTTRQNERREFILTADQVNCCCCCCYNKLHCCCFASFASSGCRCVDVRGS